MLTRLRVTNFKNLVDVDVRFGPFTCVAGANGVGKSNLFDAISFLSALADKPLMDAAKSVRDETGRTADVRSLFHHVGDRYADEMSFEADMIVPYEGVDDLGQKAEATITFLRYTVSLACRGDEGVGSQGTLELTKEKLVHINQQDAAGEIIFPHKPTWRKSVVKGRRAGGAFISTELNGEDLIIKRHMDGRGGRTLSRLAANLPRTVLSVANAAESPTALLARREMQSWRLLQLEPSSLRRPDEFNAPPRLGVDGSHLAATLHHLAHMGNGRRSNDLSAQEYSDQVYGQVASRLAELIDDVREVSIDRDERRELLTLVVTARDGTDHPARALSDGTLRFLALAVLAADPEAHGLVCLEEPENGIHPERIPAMLQLLEDIAVNVNEPVGAENPLRQVIVNTHSPAVVSQVLDDSLLVAELKESVRDGHCFQGVSFGALPGTWRAVGAKGIDVVPMGKLLVYLSPAEPLENAIAKRQLMHYFRKAPLSGTKRRRVMDRPDLQPYLPSFGGK